MKDEQSIVGTYEVVKTLAFIDGDFKLFSKKEVVANLDKKKAAGEIDEHDYDQSLLAFGRVIFTADGKVECWSPVLPSMASKVEAAVAAGKIRPPKDGHFFVEDYDWKLENGVYSYDTRQQRETFGEKQSSWDALTPNSEGLIPFGSGSMLLKKIM